MSGSSKMQRFGKDRRAELRRIAEDTHRTPLNPADQIAVDTSVHYLPTRRDAEAAAARPHRHRPQLISSIEDIMITRTTTTHATATQNTVVAVHLETTLEACEWLVRAGGAGRAVCALNFASAKNPGGGWLRGANAQEEGLCRSTRLHPCIEHSPVHGLAREDPNSCLYHDTAVYSPGVAVLKDGFGNPLDAPFLCAFITCPAPNAKEAAKRGVSPATIRAALADRIAALLAVSAYHGVTDLVLGSFGCGVFGNAVAEVAAVFRQQLAGARYRGAFETVTFAVIDPSHAAVFAAAFKTTTVGTGRAAAAAPGSGGGAIPGLAPRHGVSTTGAKPELSRKQNRKARREMGGRGKRT